MELNLQLFHFHPIFLRNPYNKLPYPILTHHIIMNKVFVINHFYIHSQVSTLNRNGYSVEMQLLDKNVVLIEI